MSNETIILILAPMVASIGTWMLTRRGRDLDNSTKICEMWRKLSEGMEKRFNDEIDELHHLNTELECRIKGLAEENVRLTQRMREMEQENLKLIAQLKIFNTNNPTT